jgi:predicted alpha/beta superfamily hydrolase
VSEEKPARKRRTPKSLIEEVQAPLSSPAPLDLEPSDAYQTGTIHTHRIYSRILRQHRTYLVYLPPGYSAQDPRLYPVIYVQDGQNVFDPRTAPFGIKWGLDDVTQALILQRRIAPLVLVAVYNSKKRLDEYTPTADLQYKGGGADNYLGFVIQELKPVIEAAYRVSPKPAATGILGSSLGGLVSLYAGWRYPEHFGRVLALSPSLWWAGRDLIMAIGGDPRPKSKNRIWMDVGTRESNDDHNGNGVADVLDETRTMKAILLQKGYKLNRDLFYQEVEGAAHTESDWGGRVGQALEALFPYTL